jgi:Ras-related protein Rab-11A
MGNTTPTKGPCTQTHQEYTERYHESRVDSIALKKLMDTSTGYPFIHLSYPYLPISRYDAMGKVVLLGDTGSGKSSILTRATKNEFCHSTHQTVGVDFGCIRFKDQSTETIIQLQIFDTAGVKRYQPMVKSFLKGCDGIAIIFDCTSIGALEKIDPYLTLVHDECENNTAIFLVRNKTDAENQHISMEQTRAFAKEKGCFCMETSAKMALNVDALFEEMATRILSTQEKQKRETVTWKIDPYIGPPVK